MKTIIMTIIFGLIMLTAVMNLVAMMDDNKKWITFNLCFTIVLVISQTLIYIYIP